MCIMVQQFRPIISSIALWFLPCYQLAPPFSPSAALYPWRHHWEQLPSALALQERQFLWFVRLPSPPFEPFLRLTSALTDGLHDSVLFHTPTDRNWRQGLHDGFSVGIKAPFCACQVWWLVSIKEKGRVKTFSIRLDLFPHENRGWTPDSSWESTFF